MSIFNYHNNILYLNMKFKKSNIPDEETFIENLNVIGTKRFYNVEISDDELNLLDDNQLQSILDTNITVENYEACQIIHNKIIKK